MNLVQINERLKDLPMQVVQQYANGMNPEVPPYLALGELQRREMSQKQMATAQGGAQGPQPSIKEQVEQKAGLMALQQMQQQQVAQQQAQPQGPMPVPAGVPQPQQQPEAMMARGGLAGIPVRRDMFEYAGGGIIAFQSGGSVEEKYRRESEEMGEGKRTRYSPDVQAYAKQLRAAENADQEGFAERERQRMLSQSREIAPQRPSPMAGPDVTAETMKRVGPMTAPKFQDPRIPAGLPAAAQEMSAAPAASRPPPAPMPSAPSRSGPPAAAMPTPPMPQGAPSAAMPQAGLPAAAQTVNPYEARLNQVALKEPVAPTTQDAISRVSELSPAAMQEAALQKRNQEMRDRASSYKEQFEKSRPSGLDDLIRVFGQAGQYKGLSGVGPAYTANQQQKRAEELGMEKQYNELMNLADTKELEGNKELFGARTRAFDTAQQLFGKEKDNVVKATASLYETTQSRINNELKMLSEKEIQNLKMAQETDIEKMRIGQRERERKSLDARDPNAKLAEYVGLKAKARELREQGKTAEADRLMARASDMMEYKGGASSGSAGERNDIAAIKNIQAGLLKELSENLRMDATTRAKKQAQLDQTYVDLARLGGASPATSTQTGKVVDFNSLPK
jgi:hypothetical protein